MREARCDASASSALEHGSGAFLLDDERYMNEAFELAERGRGRTHPNPLVGAVLVRDGRVVGRGCHLGPGELHAEAMALAEAGPLAAGATLYCTTMPCIICTKMIINAGITKVIYGEGYADELAREMIIEANIQVVQFSAAGKGETA